MPTYKVVFANGEKKELEVSARSIETDSSHGVIRFKRESSTRMYSAVIPIDRVLYIVEVDGD